MDNLTSTNAMRELASGQRFSRDKCQRARFSHAMAAMIYRGFIKLNLSSCRILLS